MAKITIQSNPNEPKYVVSDLLREELRELKKLHLPLYVQIMDRWVEDQKRLGLL